MTLLRTLALPVLLVVAPLAAQGGYGPVHDPSVALVHPAAISLAWSAGLSFQAQAFYGRPATTAQGVDLSRYDLVLSTTTPDFTACVRVSYGPSKGGVR